MSVIVDKTISPDIFDKLKNLNIDFYRSCSIDFLYSPVNTHPDMQIHFTDNNTAVAAPSAYEHYKQILPNKITLVKGKCDPCRTYPGDCAYNVAKVGNKIIGNLRYTDTQILDIYANKNYEFIDVKQGYTKCNLCVINDNSVITEDEGLYKTLSESEIDVLKIPVGSVKLSGFKNGFIGGATGFIAPNKLAFCGIINDARLAEDINSFVKSKSVDIIYLSTTDITDYGSILYF